jgi:hypothetical protein
MVARFMESVYHQLVQMVKMVIREFDTTVLSFLRDGGFARDHAHFVLAGRLRSPIMYTDVFHQEILWPYDLAPLCFAACCC